MEIVKQRINDIIIRVNKYAREPEFSKELNDRINKKPPNKISQSELLEIFVRLISYSQQAQSASVKKIIESKVFDEILENYSVEKVAKMNPCDIVEKHWHKISGIRQQTKLFQIVMFSRVLQKNDKILPLLTKPPIPHEIKTVEDINSFWIGFKELQNFLKETKTPFLRETTTLLHFLLDLGYDCIKPDSAVMKSATDIGIVEKPTSESNLIKTVRFIQDYSLERKLRPSAIDFYLLIHGEQTDAASFVRKEFYD